MLTYQDICEFVAYEYRGQRYKFATQSYRTTFSSIAAAGGTATNIINIAANADFVLCRLAYRANASAAAQTVGNVPIPLWRLQLQDSTQNQNYFYDPIDIGAAATFNGVGFCTDFNAPRMITGRSSVTATVVSYEAAQAYSMDLVLVGVSVWVFGPSAFPEGERLTTLQQ